MFKTAGFTIIKTAVLYDYPVVESIKSVLDLCDHFYVSIGDGNDSTEELIKNIASPKITILHSIWDSKLLKKGLVLSDETNKLLRKIPKKYDWLFYIQADEVLHEKYLDNVKTAMSKHFNNKNVDGLLFNYKHFFGSYDYFGTSRLWYRKEIRIIRQNPNIQSYLDAQGFRFSNNTKLHVKPIDATIYHYGWVKHPTTMYKKAINSASLYMSGDKWKKLQKDMLKAHPNEFFNYKNIDVIKKFKGVHPMIMQERIKKKNWTYKPELKKIKFKKKGHWLLFQIEKYFGLRLFEYKNYKII